MTRITNSLFESIRQVTNPVLDETKVEGKAEDAGKVDGAHFCATHVEHLLYGEGECISEAHADPDENGNIAWYTVQFADGNVRKIQTEAVKVKKAKMHEHATPEGDSIDEKKLHPNQQVLDVVDDEKIDGKDFAKLRAGKKQKAVKEESHQSKTTMKHIPNASPALKDAAKDIKPGIAGYRDRIAMLKAGGVKEETEIDEAYQTAKSEFVARQGRLAAAAAETEKDPARLKRMSGIPGYSAAMDLAKKTTLGAKHTKEEVEQVTELSTGTLLKVKHAAVRDANDATRDSDDARADKRYNLAGKASNKIELRNRAAGLKPSGQHSMDEGISETIVKHNDFTIEITDNPTFGDFLRAVQSIVRTDEESMQKEIVAIAEQAFAENYEEVIIESFTRMEIEDKLAAHRKAGNTVSNDKYSTKNGQPYAEYVVTDKEGGRKKYIHHGTTRRMESMSSVTKKDKE